MSIKTSWCLHAWIMSWNPYLIKHFHLQVHLRIIIVCADLCWVTTKLVGVHTGVKSSAFLPGISRQLHVWTGLDRLLISLYSFSAVKQVLGCGVCYKWACSGAQGWISLTQEPWGRMCCIMHQSYEPWSERGHCCWVVLIKKRLR